MFSPPPVLLDIFVASLLLDFLEDSSRVTDLVSVVNVDDVQPRVQLLNVVEVVVQLRTAISIYPDDVMESSQFGEDEVVEGDDLVPDNVEGDPVRDGILKTVYHKTCWSVGPSSRHALGDFQDLMEMSAGKNVPVHWNIMLWSFLSDVPSICQERVCKNLI